MSDHLSTLDSLPHEILTNVFVRLPIKSIVTCTAVCKTWKSLIQNPTFISIHLHHSSNNKHPLLLFRLCSSELAEAYIKSFSKLTVGENEKEQYVLHFDNQDFNEYTRFDDFPLHGQSYGELFHVVGTCNGLILLVMYRYMFSLWNPYVRKFVKLPIPNIRFSILFSRGGYGASVGFGFDSKTNDYKVVRFVKKGRRGKVEVYSLSTGKWRMVTALPPKGALSPSGTARRHVPATFVNGALHWVALRKAGNKFPDFVMVFDLGEEVFREIALPKLSDQIGDERSVRVSMSAYGNSLALFQRGYDCLSIWVMKHYADASSWSKIVSFADADAVLIDGIPRSHCIPKGFRKSGEVILEMDGGYLVSRDLQTKEVKDLRIRGYADTFVGSYVESLVLLDKPTN